MQELSGNSGERQPQSILIVDDNACVADTFSRLLQLEGFRVTTATDAKACLELAESACPDAIVLDLRMPQVTDVQLLRQLRENAHLKDVPVTILTGDYFLGDRLSSEIRALGATVQYKPVWFEELLALVRAMLSA